MADGQHTHFSEVRRTFSATTYKADASTLTEAGKPGSFVCVKCNHGQATYASSIIRAASNIHESSIYSVSAISLHVFQSNLNSFLSCVLPDNICIEVTKWKHIKYQIQ